MGRNAIATAHSITVLMRWRTRHAVAGCATGCVSRAASGSRPAWCRADPERTSGLEDSPFYLPPGLQFGKAAEAELVQDVIATPKAFLDESLASEP